MSAPLIERAQEIIGAPHVVTDPGALAGLAVDGVLPAAAGRPGTAEETAALLRAAGECGGAVLPRGAGVHQHLGGVPSRADLIVETTRLTGITDYEPADYVVAVRSGTPLRQLQAELGQHGQWLPVDPPGAALATVGGLIAANRNGPRRLLFGSIRDMLIGIRVALPTGEVIKAGGKVVKNVAGYDLAKLFIGSLGAIGIIVEATFKISPVPGAGQTVLVTVPDLSAAHELTTAIMRSYLLPSAIEAVNPRVFARIAESTGIAGVPTDGWAVLVLTEGLAESRARHVTELRALAGSRGAVAILEGPPHDAVWREVAEFPSPQSHPGAVVWRIGGPIARWADVARAAEAETDPGWVGVLSHAGLGLLYVTTPAAAAAAVHAALSAAARGGGGYAVIEAAPPAVKTQLPLWGAPPGGLELMRRVRAQFDPQGTMVPGRLGWGLS